jgi:hypothetical protein
VDRGVSDFKSVYDEKECLGRRRFRRGVLNVRRMIVEVEVALDGAMG